MDNIESDVGITFDCTNAKLETLRMEGKQGAMSELFALGPCNISFARMAQTLWHNASYGTNRYLAAVSHFDAKGNWNKPDYFTNFADDFPHFTMFPLLAEEARKAAARANKEPVCQVAVRYPYSACLAFPTDCSGKTVTALVYVYSPLAPSFGDVAAADSRLNMRVWWVKNCDASRSEMLDIRKLQLLYR